MLSWDFLSFLAFLGMIAVIVVIDRKKIEAHGPLFIRRTLRGRNFIVRTGERFSRFWTWIGNLAIVAGFAASIFLIYLLLDQVFTLLTTLQPPQGVGFVVPAPSLVIMPGVIGVPVWYWVVSIITLLVVHEGLHGIVAASQKIKIKTLGWIFLLVLPMGAFVEPDEKDVLRKSKASQLRFFAAGSFANFLVAALVGLILLPAFTAPVLVESEGVGINLIEGYPVSQSLLLQEMTNNFSAEQKPYLVLRSVNGIEIVNYGDTEDAFDQVDIRPGDTISMNLDVYYGNSKENVDISVEAAESPVNSSRGYVGISFLQGQPQVVKDELIASRTAIFFFGEMMSWIVIIHLGVGLFNMLPLGPLDGGRMYNALLERYAPKKRKKAMKIIQGFVLLVLFIVLASAVASNFI